ncbi:MAG: DUF11 domain-containing protein [Oscillatoriales cyanobacterium SM2_2_1]|nr:DUF11 domain-containing protein [Oscillatoriales cyanobacterium SM2_2_1]
MQNWQVTLAVAAGLGLASSPLLALTGGAGQPPSELLLVQQQQQPVALTLSAEIRQVRRESNGQEQVTWNPLPATAKVVPGNVLRYTVAAQNNTNRSMRNLVVSQPIPEGMVYVLQSALAAKAAGAAVDFSIDGAKTFTPNPVIRVRENGRVVEKPAPAEAYTHVRWNFGENLPANSRVLVSYQVRVR